MKQMYVFRCRLRYLSTDCRQDDHFAYSHRMRPGVNRNSHGLKVAQLAGMPQSAVTVAKEALSWLNETSPDTASKTAQLATLGQSLTASVTQQVD
jgi:DNA mismatch repair ATPase MutS